MADLPLLLLLAYGAAVAVISLLGGMLPERVRMTHTRLQVILSVVSGLMLGVAFYHLIPHSLVALSPTGGIDAVVWWVVVGLVLMLLLLRLFHFHQHDFTGEESGQHRHDEDCQHEHGVPPAVVPADAAHPLSWVGIALGLSLHTIIDGVALAAAVQAEAMGAATASLFGLGVFLAILLHKPLDAMSIATLMDAGGWSRSSRFTANLLFALMCPAGALLFFAGVNALGPAGTEWVGIALAFAAGAFICIALSDLLPEVHFHSHDRVKLTLAFVFGLLLAYGMSLLEPGHMHEVQGSGVGLHEDHAWQK